MLWTLKLILSYPLNLTNILKINLWNRFTKNKTPPSIVLLKTHFLSVPSSSTLAIKPTLDCFIVTMAICIVGGKLFPSTWTRKFKLLPWHFTRSNVQTLIASIRSNQNYPSKGNETADPNDQKKKQIPNYSHKIGIQTQLPPAQSKRPISSIRKAVKTEINQSAFVRLISRVWNQKGLT